MGVTVGQIQAVMKTLYPNGFEEVVYKDVPFLALMKKTKKFGGDSKKIPVAYGYPPSRSATFSKAMGVRDKPWSAEAFSLTRRRDYSVVSLDTETILASEGNDAAFVEAFKWHMDGALNSLRQNMGMVCFGNGSGRRGRIAAGGITASTITLENKYDIVNFEKGMVLVLNAVETGSAGTIKAGTLEIATIDRSAGTFTTTVAVATGVPTAAPADYIYADGDYDQLPTGLGGWNPATVTSTPFYGVDRTKDANRLGGIRFDGTSYNHEEALIQASAQASLEGATPDAVFVHPIDRAALISLLGSKVQYVDLNIGRISFRSVVVTGAAGDIKVIADRRQTKGIANMVTMDTWEFHSIGEAPRPLKLDGGDFQMEDQLDAHQFRLGYYGNISCNAPGWNVRIALPT